jgi:tRNA(adenine34) deaminase
MNDIDFMTEALVEAKRAYDTGECPVGAVLVRNGETIARAGNQVYQRKDPTAHAEILVLRQAGPLLGQWKFRDCVIYTSLEPCPMCENALLQAEVPRVVYGATGIKRIKDVRFAKSNLARVGPLLEDECRSLFIQWLRDTGHGDFLASEGIA